jgi:PEP-CTERM motif
MKIVPIASILFISLSAAAEAVVIAADSFLVGSNPAAGEYTATQITGQGPTVPGYTGTWVNGNASAVVTASGLSYPGLQTSGGALLGNSGASREGRILSNPVAGTTAGTFYLSFLLQVSNTGGNYRAFELHSGGFDDTNNRTLQIGQGGTGTDFGGATNFGLRLFSNDAFRIDLGTADTNVNLFVVRFNLSATNNADAITVYRNPASLTTEPAIAAGSLSGFNFTADRTSLANFQAGVANNITLDEIRIGDSYASVLSVPEPSSSLMVLLGSAFGLARRRQR